MYRVKTTVKEIVRQNGEKTVHSYEATEIELLAGQTEKGVPSSRNSNNSIYAANLLQGIESVNNPGTLLLENHSKVVDKNGEPQVVYHGTPHFGFSVFDDRKTYFGIFFSTKARTAAAYTGKAKATFPRITNGLPRRDGGIYKCFINARNTLHVTPSNKSLWNGIGIHSIQLSQQDLDFINRERNLPPEDFGTDEYFLSDFKEEYDRGVETTTDNIARLAKILGYDSVRISRVRDGNRTIADDWIMLKGGATIKSATDNVGTYDTNNDDIRFAIGKKRKDDMRKGLLNKLTNASEEQVEQTITEIEKLGEQSKAGGDAKVEKAALHWVKQGTIILPEDGPKVLEAVKMATDKGIDVSKYDSRCVLPVRIPAVY